MNGLLSKKAEKLLKRILRNSEKEEFDIDEFVKEFDDISDIEDSKLRSIYDELIENKMILVDWGDSVPCEIEVTNKGDDYFRQKRIKIAAFIFEKLCNLISFLAGLYVGMMK